LLLGQNRPIVVTWKPDGPEHPDYDTAVRNIVYALEKATAMMAPQGDGKWIWIMDLQHFSYDWHAGNGCIFLSLSLIAISSQVFVCREDF
jgi:hypothetical protein